MCLKCLISSLFSRMCRKAVCHFIKKERNKCTRGKGKKLNTHHAPKTLKKQLLTYQQIRIVLIIGARLGK